MTDNENTLQDNLQGELPFAVVKGEPMTVPPEDLYIPPDALEIFLDAFEGPLDLLLYLIKRQNLDILSLPVFQITQQYMSYIELMKEIRLELAAEYLVMAAMLAEIKSRLLLPRPVEEDDEDDPRAELIRRLQEYERFKKVAEEINEITRMHRDTFGVSVIQAEYQHERPQPTVGLKDVIAAFQEVMQRAKMFASHHIDREPLSVRERMSRILTMLNVEDFVEFNRFYNVEEGRSGVIVTFLAMLELIKEHVIELVQSEPYAPIYIKPAVKGPVEEELL
ncbi:MAG: segregation/condensation protein A [Gammaproteobacteria bacterium]|nr:segregation/condensation protein A [Gammaproteobacteria bacterium]